MDRCPTCGEPSPCPTCGDSGDLTHIAPHLEQVQLGKRASWTLHQLRRSYAADGKTAATTATEDIIRMVDDLVESTKALGVH